MYSRSLLLCAIYTNKTLNTFVLLPIFKFQVRSVSYVYLTGPTLKTFGNFQSFFTTSRTNFIIMNQFHQPKTKYIWFNAGPSIPILVCKLYLSQWIHPKAFLEKFETLVLLPTTRTLLFCIIYTNKTLRLFHCWSLK